MTSSAGSDTGCVGPLVAVVLYGGWVYFLIHVLGAPWWAVFL